jgi:hypothetical protein
MKKQRTIKYNGLDFTINIDTKQIEDKVKGKYRPTIDGLRRLLNKREKYIQKLHNTLRDEDAIMFLFAGAKEVWRKAVKVHSLTPKEYIIITYLRGVNMATKEHITGHINSLGYAKAMYSDLCRLEKKGVIFRTPQYGYWAITDKGRKSISQVIQAIKQDYSYYKENKAKKHDHYIKEKSTTPKYSPQELEKRSFLYKQMMRPFWDGGYKVLPRSKERRVEYLINWIQDKKARGITVDKVYYTYIERWSAPDRRVTKNI